MVDDKEFLELLKSKETIEKITKMTTAEINAELKKVGIKIELNDAQCEELKKICRTQLMNFLKSN
jgi:hypothetical protein